MKLLKYGKDIEEAVLLLRYRTLDIHSLSHYYLSYASIAKFFNLTPGQVVHICSKWK